MALTNLSWQITLVTEGIEHLKVVNNGNIICEGSYPSGYTRHMNLGDVVWIKQGRKWLKKFGIEVYKNKPVLRLGACMGGDNKRIPI